MTDQITHNIGHRVLATDLDGTLIPLPNEPANTADLKTLGEEFDNDNATLVFVTGRHFESVMDAIQQFQLPQPEWIICDVGTSIFHRESSSKFNPVGTYHDHLAEIIASFPIQQLKATLSDASGLRLQEEEKQGPFKLSYYADAKKLEELVQQAQIQLDNHHAPYGIIHSIDPFNGDGLIDMLPSGVSKAHALAWWVDHARLDPESVVFAGDSGNDVAALTAGYQAIVVANADRSVAERVSEAHRRAGWKNRLHLASNEATSGVLEGWQWFGLP